MQSGALIYMVALDHVPPSTLAALDTRITGTFDATVEARAPGFDAAAVGFDPERNQYSSTRILTALLDDLPPGDARAIAITGLDLFVPVLTFVFGEAQLGGRVAIASHFRLHNSFYGLPEDHDLVVARLEKEVVHELGHTYGLRHCDNPGCVMYATPAVEEVDVKGVGICRACRARAGLRID